MRKVLLVGWDGAGWNRIHPLLDAGAMPQLARLVENGVMGDLASLSPPCSALLWTSVTSGRLADTHGILDSVEPDPVTGGVRPVTRASLTAAHIWEILTREGIRSQAIGWPATHPAQGPAVCVSNGFEHGVPGSISPSELESTLTPLRFGPQEWTGDELHLFVPELARIDQDKDKRLAQLAVLLAHIVSVQAAATTLMETADWEFSAVWFGAVSRAVELFPHDTDAVYQEVVSGVYRFLDLLLGRLVTLAGPEAAVILVSDRTAGEAEWQESTGHGSRAMLCAAGPGIAHDELAFGAGLLDITPTILGLFGYAPASGMVGHTIPEICATAPTRALQNAPQSTSHLQSKIDLEELEDLGYVDSVAAANRPQAEAARIRREFHLAQVLLGDERPAEAIPVLERISAQSPQRVDLRIYLAHAYRLSERYSESRSLCEGLLAEHPGSPLAPLVWAHLAISQGDLSGAREHLTSAKEHYGLAAALDSAIGLAYLRTENWNDAANAFRSAIRTDPWMAGAHEGLARALAGSQQFSEAAEAALDAIRLRYDRPAAHGILGTALRALGREEAAMGAFATCESLSRRAMAA